MNDTFGIHSALKELGIEEINNGSSTGKNSFSSGEIIESFSPVTGKLIGKVKCTTKIDYEEVMKSATSAFIYWRSVPAPKRGEIVRQFGDKLRDHKEALGKLVSFEMG